MVKETNSASWNLPGGGMEHRDTDHQAMVRELYKEIGHTGTFTMEPISTQSMLLKSQSAMQLWIAYELALNTGKISIGKEVTGITFVDPITF